MLGRLSVDFNTPSKDKTPDYSEASNHICVQN